jgi:hypothetical protein
VAVGDFNGDGVPDLAVADVSGAGVSVLLGQGDGTFRPKLGYGVGSSPVSVAVGDFNGDGFPDLVTANSGSNNVSVLLNAADWSPGPSPGRRRQAPGHGGAPLALALAAASGRAAPPPARPSPAPAACGAAALAVSSPQGAAADQRFAAAAREDHRPAFARPRPVAWRGEDRWLDLPWVPVGAGDLLP